MIQCSPGCKEGGCCRKSSDKWPGQEETVEVMFCEGTCKNWQNIDWEDKRLMLLFKTYLLNYYFIWLCQILAVECRIFQLWHENYSLWHVGSGSPVRDWRVLMMQLKGIRECGVLVMDHQGSPQCYSELQLSSSDSWSHHLRSLTNCSIRWSLNL